MKNRADLALVTAELVRSVLPEQESAGRKNHEVGFSYSIPAR